MSRRRTTFRMPWAHRWALAWDILRGRFVRIQETWDSRNAEHEIILTSYNRKDYFG